MPSATRRDLLARALPQLDEARDQRDRQVVDAVEAEVLEDVERRALARAREPGDDDGVEPLRSSRRARHAPRPPRGVARSSRAGEVRARCGGRASAAAGCAPRSR